MKQLSYEEFRSMISIVDVAKQIGYSDRTAWAKEKRSKANPCLQNANGDQIIISHPNVLPGEMYFNPQDSSDKGDLITFVMKKLNLDRKGVNTYLTGFINNQPLIQQTKPEWSIKEVVNDIGFKSFYFKFSDLSPNNLNYLASRGISLDTLNSSVFKGFFKTVQLPLFKNGKFTSYGKEEFLAIQYQEEINGDITGVDYRNAQIQKHGVTSRKSTSVGLSNIPNTVNTIFVTESGIDAISHYQLKKPGDDVLYIITGGNLTLGQLLAIDKIKAQLNSDGDITTHLLFDNDVAGSVYDLKYIAHTINQSSDEDLINIELNKETIIIEINAEPLPVKLCEQLITIGSLTDNTVTTQAGGLKINARKETRNLKNLSNILLDLFAIKEVLQLQKSPVKKDWNDAVILNPLLVTPTDILQTSKSHVMANDKLVKPAVSQSTLPAEQTILKKIGILISSFIDIIEASIEEEKKSRLLYGTVEKKIKTLSTERNIITFIDPIKWKGDPYRQISITELKQTKSGAVKIIGFARDTPWYENMDALIKAVDWNKMESYHNEYLEVINNKPITFSLKEVGQHIHDLFGVTVSEKETALFLNALKERFDHNLSQDTNELINELTNFSNNTLATALLSVNTQLGDNSTHYAIFQKHEMLKTNQTFQNLHASQSDKLVCSNKYFAITKEGLLSLFNEISSKHGDALKTIVIVSDRRAGELEIYKTLIDPAYLSNYLHSSRESALQYCRDNVNEFEKFQITEIINIPSLFSQLDLQPSQELLNEFPTIFSSQSGNKTMSKTSAFYVIEEGLYATNPIAPYERFSQYTIDELNKIHTQLQTTFNNELKEDNFQICKILQKEIGDLTNYIKSHSSSQFKNKTMSQTNAGEQTQKTQSERLEGIMKSLGLKDVWDQLSQKFQTWADGNEEGRKSFSFENKTFRRTGYADPSRNIATDMVADIALNFNKNDKGVFFNSYTVELKNSIINGIKPEKRQAVKDTFEISLKKDESANNLSIKKALNLLDGRSICIGENNWIKRNGNEVVEYKFDVAKAIKDNKHVNFSTTSAEHMDSALESLKKGDYALISCEIDQKPVHVFLTADAQYKKVEANDNTLYRHLSEAEKDQIHENMNHKQDQVQGSKQHP